MRFKITGATEEQQARADELEAKLNAGHDRNYEDFDVWQCWDDKTIVAYSNVSCSKDYELDTDDIDEVVAIFNSERREDYCTHSKYYDYD